MKKLLIATDCFLPRWDGIARFLDSLLPRISQTFEITLLAPDFKGAPVSYKNVKIIRIPLLPFTIGDFTPARRCTDIIKTQVQKHDCVWIQTIGSIGQLCATFAKKLQKPYAVYIHSIDWQLVHRSLSHKNILAKPFGAVAKHIAKKIYSNAKILFVPSKEVKELMVWNGIQTDCEIIHLGIDTTLFAPNPNKNELKVELGFLPEHIIIGYVGRISREKDILTLYRAFIRLYKEFENVRLLIIGDGLSEYKEKLSKHPHIIVKGSQEQVQRYYQIMDIFTLPSLLETTSLATLEAMSTQLPVVCTPVGLIKEYVKDKENGFLFPLSNSLILSMKLKWLLEEPQLRHEIGLFARKTVEQEFSWDKTVSQIVTQLQQL